MSSFDFLQSFKRLTTVFSPWTMKYRSLAGGASLSPWSQGEGQAHQAGSWGVWGPSWLIPSLAFNYILLLISGNLCFKQNI